MGTIRSWKTPARTLAIGAAAVAVIVVAVCGVLAYSVAKTATASTSHTGGSGGAAAATTATSAGLPDYQPSKVVSKTSGSTVLESSDSVRTIGEFYADALAKGGWQVTTSSAGSYHASFTAHRGDEGTSISVYPRLGGSGISISTYPRSLVAGLITAIGIGGAVVLVGAAAAWALLWRRRVRRAGTPRQPVPATTKARQTIAQ